MHFPAKQGGGFLAKAIELTGKKEYNKPNYLICCFRRLCLMTLQEYLTSLRHKTVAVIGIGVSNTPLLRRQQLRHVRP